jgi:hypothetical protein
MRRREREGEGERGRERVVRDKVNWWWARHFIGANGEVRWGGLQCDRRFAKG